VEWLLLEHDRAIAQWQQDNPDVDVYEERLLEITSSLSINVEMQIKDVLVAMDG